MAVALSLSAHQHRLLGGVGVIPALPGNRLIWMNCGATSTVSWAGCSATRTVARAVLVGAMEVGFNQT